MQSAKQSIKPVLRWAGSKRKLIPELSNFWSDSFERYVEPFVGSACLFFALQPKRALLSDLNPELIESYKVIRSDPAELASRLATIKIGSRQYYALRKQAPSEFDRIGRVARFLYLNRYCFNGLFRTNNLGNFNVPYGGGRTGQLPSLDHLKSVSKTLRRCSLKTGDFESILEETRMGDFVYLDPPFAVANRRVFRQYGPQNFGIEDLRRLSIALKKIDKQGVKFVLSYAYCREALELFSQWNKRKVFVRRNIAGFTTCRRTAAELIVSNLS